MKWRAIWQTPKKAVLDFIQDDAITLAAALAFYAMLSLAPLLVLALTVLGFLGEPTQQRVIEQTETLIGPQASQGLELLLQNASAQRVAATASAIIGLVTVILSATAVFVQLQYSLNRIFNVRAKRGAVKGWLYKRFMSLLTVFAIGLVIVASVVASSVISFMFQGAGPAAQIINLAVSLVVFTLIFVILFRFLPDIKITWKDTLAGAVIAGLLFVIGQYAVGMYLGSTGVSSVYGGAGALVILLLWVYYSAIILFLGAEMTQAYAAVVGKEIVPNEFAEWTPAAARAHEKRPEPEPEPAHAGVE
ncbi:MAG: YihY/virulence factor BrkB family protein [Planctomycetes bacterium]|nr:YihY/virulence factor BrkB family protein [Planctomycetota bacterium]